MYGEAARRHTPVTKIYTLITGLMGLKRLFPGGLIKRGQLIGPCPGHLCPTRTGRQTKRCAITSGPTGVTTREAFVRLHPRPNLARLFLVSRATYTVWKRGEVTTYQLNDSKQRPVWMCVLIWVSDHPHGIAYCAKPSLVAAFAVINSMNEFVGKNT